MAARSTNWRLWAKMLTAGGVVCIGGPALVYYVSPSEDELFLKYNPDLQKRSLQNRIGRQQDFDNFVGKLKEYSKSDKPIWDAAAEAEKNRRENSMAEQKKLIEETRTSKEEMRNEGNLVPGGSL